MRRFPEILTIALCLILFAVLTACGPKGGPLTAEEAVTKVQALIAKPEALGVLNYDAPEVETVTENESHMVSSVAENGRDRDGNPKQTDIKGKTVYKITFRTDRDEKQGPIVLYVDCGTGEVYGMDAR